MLRGRWLLWLLVMVLTVSVAALAGCGRKAASEKLAEGMMEKTLERATGGDVDLDLGGGGKDVTIKTKEGTTTMSETTEWPSDILTEVPRFTYGKVERVTRTTDTQNGQKSMMVWVVEVQDGAMEKYSKDLEGAGWDVQMSISGGEGGMVTAQKGNLGLSIAYNTEDRTTVVNAYSTVEE